MNCIQDLRIKAQLHCLEQDDTGMPQNCYTNIVWSKLYIFVWYIDHWVCSKCIMINKKEINIYNKSINNESNKYCHLRPSTDKKKKSHRYECKFQIPPLYLSGINIWGKSYAKQIFFKNFDSACRNVSLSHWSVTAFCFFLFQLPLFPSPCLYLDHNILIAV